MITQLRGRLVEKSPTSVVIDCQGVGYLVNISLFTFGQLTDDENIQLFTHLQVREDAHTLYGFTTALERQLFRLLIGISGIGANTARTMLSSLSPSEIGQAIQGEQVDVIQSVKELEQRPPNVWSLNCATKYKLLLPMREFLRFQAIPIEKRRYLLW